MKLRKLHRGDRGTIRGGSFKSFFAGAKKLVSKGVEGVSRLLKSDGFNTAKNIGVAVGQATGKVSVDARPGFAGELHAISLSGKNRGTPYSYAGPGTNLEARLARGDPPINKIDAVSKQHDIDYSKAQTFEDVRNADERFVLGVKLNEAEDPLVAKIILRIFQGKMISEDAGLLDWRKFLDGQKNGTASWMAMAKAVDGAGIAGRGTSELENEIMMAKQIALLEAKPGEMAKLKSSTPSRLNDKVNMADFSKAQIEGLREAGKLAQTRQDNRAARERIDRLIRGESESGSGLIKKTRQPLNVGETGLYRHGRGHADQRESAVKWKCCKSCDMGKKTKRGQMMPCDNLPGRELKLKYLAAA